tara:strand:- start:51 stop:452 length:402 start_codon:yes stop_codon:yes gene_type:complete
MEKYLYFRKQTDIDSDDGVDDSLYLPVSRITGLEVVSSTRLGIIFSSLNNQAGNSADDEVVVSDNVLLTVTAGHMKEAMQAIVRAINKGPHSDGAIVIADAVTTNLADATVTASFVHPKITGVQGINISTVLS